MKKISRLLVFLLLAGVLFGCKKEEEQKEILLREYDEDDYKGMDFTLESDELLFEFDPETTQFTVTQKNVVDENGQPKVWYSTPKDAASDGMADSTSKKLLQSTLVIEYTTVDDLKTTLTTFEHSLENKLYTLEKIEDGKAIKVNYSIGRVKKKFFIPPAVPEERFRVYYDQMDKSLKRKVDNSYRKLDINNLLPTDDVKELLALYPDLETVNVYVVRDSTKDSMKELLQEEFAKLGYNEEEYEKDLLYYPNASSTDNPVYNISVIYRINGNRLEVEVPMDEIEYRTDVPLTKISLLPYFGAGGVSDEGYLFVPEGSGAIIDFNNGKSNLKDYYAQLYGWDSGLKREDNAIINETRAAFPVFGIANGNASMVGVVDEYSTLATIRADVSGRRSGYNFAYVTYDMIHSSKMDISAKSDKTVLAFEKKLPKGNIKQCYYFIEGTDYVDMAKTYRDYLTEKSPELVKVADADLPVAVEFIGAVDRVKQVLGMPVTMPEVLTSFDDATKILKDMVKTGYDNISVRYSGWMNGGIDHSLPKDIDLTSGMGGKKALDALLKYAKSSGISMYLSGRTQNVYDSNLLDGYLQSRDVAKYLSREAVEVPEFSHIWFGGIDEVRIEPHYLLRPSVCVTLMQSIADYAKDKKTGVGFEDTGYLLSGDYNKKRTTVREKSMDMQVEALASIKKSGVPVMLTGGNEYVLPYADIITEMDLEGQDILILDRKVPFYQIAIHNLVDYTGNALNLADDPVDVILKSAECGAGLSFAYIAAKADILQDTEYMDFFGANYDSWKNKASDYYLRYKNEMAGLNDKEIIDHEFLADGVTKTVYEDNTVVYVNQSTVEYSDNAVTVPARDYLVERSGK